MVLENNELTSDTSVPSIPNVSFHVYLINCLKELVPTLPEGAVYMMDWTTKKSIRYSEIVPFVSLLTTGLCSRGLKAGDCVCVYASNHVEFPLLALAIWQCDAKFTTVAVSNSSSEVADRCRETNSQYICSDVLRAGKAAEAVKICCDTVREIWSLDGESEGCISLSDLMNSGKHANEDVGSDFETDFETVIWLPYSSGTTGLPKGIMHTHRTLVAMMDSIRSCKTIPGSPGKNLFINFMVHVGGIMVSLLWMTYGTHCVILSQYSDMALLEAIAETKIKGLSVFPSQMAFLIRNPVVKNYDLSNVEVFSVGGSSWNVDDETRLRNVFPNLQDFSVGYGMTEIGMVSTTMLKPKSAPSVERKVGSSGWLFPGATVKISDSTGSALGVNVEGEVCVRTVSMMKGYLNHPKETDDFFKDDWAHTGDSGYFDELGQLFITGRIKELIKYRMAHVPPVKLEILLKTLDSVEDACVVGIPHEIDGEHPAAAVVLAPGASESPSSIRQFIDARANEEEKLRGGVFLVKKILYNDNGKPVRRHVLKEIVKIREACVNL